MTFRDRRDQSVRLRAGVPLAVTTVVTRGSVCVSVCRWRSRPPYCPVRPSVCRCVGTGSVPADSAVVLSGPSVCVPVCRWTVPSYCPVRPSVCRCAGGQCRRIVRSVRLCASVCRFFFRPPSTRKKSKSGRWSIVGNFCVMFPRSVFSKNF